MIEFEIKRALGTRVFQMVIIAGFMISLFHFVDLIKITERYVNWGEKPPLIQSYLGGDIQTSVPDLFRLLVPLIATMPFSWSYFSDYRSGYLGIVFSYTDRKKILSCRCFVSFILGGVAVVFPLLVSMLFCATYWPNYDPIIYNLLGGPWEGDFLAGVFYSSPLLYMLFFTLVMFMIGGTCACIGLFCGIFASRRIQVFAYPVLFVVFQDIAMSQIGLRAEEYSILHMMNMLNGIRLYPFLLTIGGLLLASAVGFVLLGSRRDVLGHYDL